MIEKILIRGAKVHNLKNIDVDIPLGKIVGIAGVSGSGKSSLAMGVLYAEGSRRYLEALSTYTRRRMTQASKASVDEVLYVPAALALHQRPGIPGIRSTFGTGTELLNSLRLMYSRLSNHRCPNGHYLKPSLAVAAGKELVCSECGVHFYAPSAEELAFNSQGACQKCGGTGIVHAVDMASLVPDDSLTIDDGAVAPWNSLMWSLMTDVCREMGVRTDVPFRDLTEQEKDIVYHGPAVKKHLFYKSKNTENAGELDFTYFNAVYTVENALAKVKDEKGMKRVEKFLKEDICPECHGTRLSAAARAPKLRGISLDEVCNMTLSELVDWVRGVPTSLPDEMKPMAESICETFESMAKRLIDLGLGYLTLDRSAATLSTGERQRMQLARAVRNRTTGVLYVLDEPSVGLHSHDIHLLKASVRKLRDHGNTVLLVEHHKEMIQIADHIVDMGPGSGMEGGRILYEGDYAGLLRSDTLTGRMLGENTPLKESLRIPSGWFTVKHARLHNLKDVTVDLPMGVLAVIAGVAGSGKSSLMECFRRDFPEEVIYISQKNIGISLRSTPATYLGVADDIRKLFAKESKAGLSMFTFNGKGGCPVCGGKGVIVSDMAFMDSIETVCEACGGLRYSPEALRYTVDGLTIAEVMDLTVRKASLRFAGTVIAEKLRPLMLVGLGYLHLNQALSTLSGGELQRVKLASYLGTQSKVFVLDEPTDGLHVKDIRHIISLFDSMVDQGNSVFLIEHNLNVLKAADYVIEIGPGGGLMGGEILFSGTPKELLSCERSVTKDYLV